MAGVVTPLLRFLDGCLHALSARLARWTKPHISSFPLGTLTDLDKSKSELIILKRQVKRPAWVQPLTVVDNSTSLLSA